MADRYINKKCTLCERPVSRVEGCDKGSCRDCILLACQECCENNTIEHIENLREINNEYFNME